MQKRLLLLLFYFFSLSFFASAQQTKISGMVYDSRTREPLPFVNIKYKGANVFTVTDIDGKFSLSTTTPTDTLVISYIGYKTKKIKIQKNAAVVKNIALDPSELDLQEVVIVPGENPALRIFRKVIEHKRENNRDKLDSYEYEVYNKVEVDLNNIPKQYKQKKTLRPIKFIFDYIDSNNVKEKPFLPIFLSETMSDFYYNKNPRLTKEVIKASKVSGLQDASVSQFLGQMYQNVNIYDNSMLVFQKRFMSPIANSGQLYYKYYLIDSMFIGNTWCYQLQFKPRRKEELTFAGNMWIADTSFAVKRLEMSMASDANINFINTFNVVQEYQKVDSTWMLSKDKLVVDFKFEKNKMGFYGRKNTSYEKIKIDQPRDEKFFSNAENIQLDNDAVKKNDAFWAKERPDSLSKNEKQIYKMVDTIQSLPIYRTWYDWVYLFTVGYKRYGDFEFGPYYKTYSSNLVEGNRFRLGGRTSDKFSKWCELNGYTAYGLKDERYKYGIGFKTFVTKKPRQIFYINYKDDMEVLGQSTNAFSHDNILATAFRRKPLSTLTSIQQFQTSYEYEPFQGLNNQIFLTNKVMSPKGDQVFEYHAPDGSGQLLHRNNIIASEVSAIIQFAYHQKYVSGTFTRISMGTHYPILQFQYTEGLKGIFNSDYHYRKMSLSINDRIRLVHILGYTDYIIEGGKIFGTVPFPLLELHGGNETVIYDPLAYNMMNYYEFGSDQYLTVQLSHHFDGFFLNHIPLMRKLKWREVVGGKYLVGSISSKNSNANTSTEHLIFPTTLSSLNRGPYYEVSAGVENIFKIFRIDALWRLSYIDKNYVDYYNSRGGSKVPIFGIRWSLQVAF